MSDLIAIAYPDEAAARRACTNLTAGVERRLLDVEDVLVITHDKDGRISPIFDAWDVGFTGGVSVIAGGLIGTLHDPHHARERTGGTARRRAHRGEEQVIGGDHAAADCSSTASTSV